MAESFSAEERAAMKERARELKAAKGAEAELHACLDSIAAMSAQDRVLAEAVHRLVLAAAPVLKAKTWYGQPAYALDGKVVVFFQGSGKFSTRYSTLGFSENAKLDDGGMWPSSFALMSLSSDDEALISQLVKKAVG